MNNDTISPVAVMGNTKEGFPAAYLLNKDQSISFSPLYVAGGLISVYEAFLAHVPESRQIAFEESFKECFEKAFEVRHEYMKTMNIKSNK